MKSLAGNQDFEAFKQNYTTFGNCFVAVCSVDNLETVKALRHRVEYIIKIKERPVNDTPIVFVINKVDLLETNRDETLNEFKKEINLIIKEFSLLNTSIVESSAKKGENINLIFEEGVRMERFYRVDSLPILQNVISKDSALLQEIKPSKRCFIM